MSASVPIQPLNPPLALEASIAEKAARIPDATVAALKGEEFEAERNVRPRTPDKNPRDSLIALANVAIPLTVIGLAGHD
jgi:hypothetical protein